MVKPNLDGTAQKLFLGALLNVTCVLALACARALWLVKCQNHVLLLFFRYTATHIAELGQRIDIVRLQYWCSLCRLCSTRNLSDFLRQSLHFFDNLVDTGEA